MLHNTATDVSMTTINAGMAVLSGMFSSGHVTLVEIYYCKEQIEWIIYGSLEKLSLLGQVNSPKPSTLVTLEGLGHPPVKQTEARMHVASAQQW